MLFVNQDMALQQEYNNNIKYITDEEKQEVFKNLNNINYLKDNISSEALKMAVMLLTLDEIPQDMFLNYTYEELDEILEKAEVLLEDALINGDINKNSKLYKCQVISKIATTLESTKSKEIKDLPISALFF